jgi:hypothetical protein
MLDFRDLLHCSAFDRTGILLGLYADIDLRHDYRKTRDDFRQVAELLK